MTIYEEGLSANNANYTPLTPVDFLERAAETWPNKTAIIHSDIPIRASSDSGPILLVDRNLNIGGAKK